MFDRRYFGRDLLVAIGVLLLGGVLALILFPVTIALAELPTYYRALLF